jgi:hypothetical protein|tara:strand:+ start:739 stop:996 length:258 start_codon:yes stop_codon:yes gene_type:complete
MKITKNLLRQLIKEQFESSMVQEAEGETAQDVAARLMKIPPEFRQSVVRDFENMAEGGTEMAQYYPHVQDLAAFAREVLGLLGSQ